MRYATNEGFYSIIEMPNQPSIAICFDFTIYPQYRGQKSGHSLKRHQMETLVRQGFTSAICTTQSANLAQRRVLEKAGWKVLSPFIDQRTDSTALLWKWDRY